MATNSHVLRHRSSLKLTKKDNKSDKKNKNEKKQKPSSTTKDSKQEQPPSLPSSSSTTLPSTSTSTSTSTSITSLIPDVPFDIAWTPLVPKGHTVFSWGDEINEDLPNSECKEEKYPEKKREEPMKDEENENSNNKKKHEKQSKKSEKNEKKNENKDSKKEKAQGKGKAKEEISEKKISFYDLDIRVGRIVKADNHPNPEAQKLLVEQIDIGEGKTRTIVSGIKAHYTPSDLNGKFVAVIANLKPFVFMKETSCGMVLAASTETKDKVELVTPPHGAGIGERITVKGQNVTGPEIDMDGKKKFPLYSPFLKTNGECVATWDGVELMTSAGPCTVPTLANSRVS